MTGTNESRGPDDASKPRRANDSSRPSRPTRASPPGTLGSLCPRCAHVKTIATAKGSAFFLCELSKADPRWPKYPPQPVLACAGFER